MVKNKLWVECYDAGVPASIPYPNICAHDYLVKQARNHPTRPAIIADSVAISYQTLAKTVELLSLQLLKRGINPGDRVGVCLPNSPGFVVAFFAVLQAGGVVAAMNPNFPKRELEFQVNTADVKFVITENAKFTNFQSMEKLELSNILQISEDLHLLDSTNKRISTRERQENPVVQFTFPVLNPSVPAVLQFSGGTTGIPKAAIGTHSNLVANVTQFSNWLVNIKDGKETFLITIPLYHVYGLVLGLLLGVAKGATLVLVANPGNVEEMLQAIKRYPISYFPAVPSIFNMINNHKGVVSGDYDLHRIKACISGSAPLLESVRMNFERLTGGSLVEGYGLSEAPTATHCNPVLGEKRAGSIGLPLPDVECRIVRIENDQIEVSQGEEGELLIRGPQVMKGYFNAEGETAAALAGGWLHTGDIARMDKDGYFYISGRIKDLIKVHGMQVWPVEVEEVLSKHPLIMECAVAGVPDEMSGERVKAWLVLQNGEKLDVDEVRGFCAGKIAAYKIPSEIKICPTLPKTPVGKVLRRELVREHVEGR